MSTEAVEAVAEFLWERGLSPYPWQALGYMDKFNTRAEATDIVNAARPVIRDEVLAYLIEFIGDEGVWTADMLKREMGEQDE